jgi:hypothetical protein
MVNRTMAVRADVWPEGPGQRAGQLSLGMCFPRERRHTPAQSSPDRLPPTMSKPRGILWLEEQTGQTLSMPETMPPAPKGRHVSIRVSDELYTQLEAAAAKGSESVSRTARRILADGLTQRSDTETAIDDATAALTKAKAQLPASAPHLSSPPQRATSARHVIARCQPPASAPRVSAPRSAPRQRPVSAPD